MESKTIVILFTCTESTINYKMKNYITSQYRNIRQNKTVIKYITKDTHKDDALENILIWPPTSPS